MRTILLDSDADAVPPEGYQVISDEIAFLQRATGTTPLFIRGAELCDWARQFYAGRGRQCMEAYSPMTRIVQVCPGLTRAQAHAVYADLGNRLPDATPLTVPRLLQALYPGRLWTDEPSWHHAAEWLLWLWRTQPPDHIQPLLAQLTQGWQEDVPPGLVAVYQTTQAESAHALLCRWLGIEGNGTLTDQLALFPLVVPDELRQKAQAVWHRAAIHSQGTFFAEGRWQRVPRSLAEIAAEETAVYLEKHPERLSAGLFEALLPYLPSETAQRLRRFLPPPRPVAPPQEPEAVLAWFAEQYLPYRTWQVRWGGADDTAHVHNLAQQFAQWYLDAYPRALMGSVLGKGLSFSRAAALSAQEGAQVTLLVVLDGLHLQDARQVVERLRQRTPRLTITEDLAFAPLPTVTGFTKPPLLTGTAPYRCDEAPYLGPIVTGGKMPTEALRQAEGRGMVLWRSEEPDHTYHVLNSYDTLPAEIEAQLDKAARKIADVVEQVPADVRLNIVLTTDHGRLLATSPRRLAVPTGMTAHQRAAWGAGGRDFPAAGFVIEGEIVYLHAGRFGLPQETAVVLTDAMFETQDGRGGQEKYPHGGLFPEEVIVPWMAMARDAQPPQIEIYLAGRAVARSTGQLRLVIVNLDAVPCQLKALHLHLGEAETRVLPVNEPVPGNDRAEYAVPLAAWPSAAVAEQATATADIQQPHGLILNITAKEVTLQSDELYRKENILGDLTL